MRTIFHNAEVYTGSLPFAQAFCVEDGKFTAVGSDSEILAMAEKDDEVVDLGGSFVSAGFNDSHMHLLNFGQALRMAQLAGHTRSLRDMLDHVRAFLEEHPVREGQWLRGRGWNQDYFTDVHRMPCKEDLDAISQEIPIMLTRACGHSCVLNSKALQIAGITAQTQAPEGGAIGMRDGEPDGMLYDNAIRLAQDCVPAPDREEIRQMILAACRALNSYGITSSQTDDYCVFSNVDPLLINDAYRELEEEGLLTVRVYEQSNFTDLASLSAFIEAGNVTGTGTDLFKIGPLKMLGDGSLGSRTAHLSRPYADDPSTCGFSLFSPEHFDEMIDYANAHGMQIAVHTIGDACLDLVLSAIEKALKNHPREDHRHGIVHCQISRADQLEKIRDLDLHVYCQSIFLDYDNHIVWQRAGEELGATSYSWKTLMNSGVSVSNGSDCPVELPDVMEGIECAVTRTSLDGTGPYLPHEAFTVQEALDSFTIRGAEGSFEEDFKGLIAPGFAADFTVLGQNPFAVPPRNIHEIPVCATYLAGKCVFERGNL